MSETSIQDQDDMHPAEPRRLAGQNRIRLIAIGFTAAFAMITGQLGLLTLWPQTDDGRGRPVPFG